MKLSLYPLALTFTFCSLSPARGPDPRVNLGKPGHQAETPRDAVLKMPDDGEMTAGQDVSDETRRKLRHEFGFSFLVYRDKIQTELGLSSEQKAALEKYLGQIAPDDIKFLQTDQAHQGGFEAYRSKAIQKLETVLASTLSAAQHKRLDELVRQREGLFGGPALWTGLQITDEEKSQFMALIEPMHKKMEAEASKAQQGANMADVQRQVLGLRADLERQLEAVLTDSQRKLWTEMLGKPIAVDALFDLSDR